MLKINQKTAFSGEVEVEVGDDGSISFAMSEGEWGHDPSVALGMDVRDVEDLIVNLRLAVQSSVRASSRKGPAARA